VLPIWLAEFAARGAHGSAGSLLLVALRKAPLAASASADEISSKSPL